MKTAVFRITLCLIALLLSCSPKNAGGKGKSAMKIEAQGYVSMRGSDMLAVLVLSAEDEEYELLRKEGADLAFSDLMSCRGEKVIVRGDLSGKGRFTSKAIIVEDFGFAPVEGYTMLLGEIIGEGLLLDKFSRKEFLLIEGGAVLKRLKEGQRVWIKGRALRDGEIEVVKSGIILPYEGRIGSLR